jgi:catecholate siderophore receptor
VKPERFTNYEMGVKWEPASAISLTAALYRLDRTNTRATDPNDPTRILQTGATRSKGFEFGVTGRVNRLWSVSGGYTNQEVKVIADTAAARAGAIVAQTPRHMFSLWNNLRVNSRLGAGLGLLNRTEMFAAIDNTVVVPGYFRADAAVYYSFTERIRLQANVENLLDRRYYANADSNTNISPGSPRAVRIALVARFK